MRVGKYNFIFIQNGNCLIEYKESGKTIKKMIPDVGRLLDQYVKIQTKQYDENR